MQRVQSRGEGVAETQPPVVQNAERKMTYPPVANKDKVKRRRRSSSLMYQEPPESLEQKNDQAVLPNLNAQWVNAKGMSINQAGFMMQKYCVVDATPLKDAPC